MLKKLAIRLGLIVLGLVFALVALEGGLRAYLVCFGPSSRSLEEQLELSRKRAPEVINGPVSVGGLIESSPFPDRVYELKANLSGVFLGKPFSLNSFGMRDREYTFEKPPGVFRIVGLGDSIMFGWGVEQSQAYLKLAEMELNQRSGAARRFEVLNFGVPGYNTTMEVATLEHLGLKFNPDLVVIHFVNNDFGVPLFMERPKDPFSIFRSYFFEFLRARLKSARVGGKPDLMSSNLEGLDYQRQNAVLGPYRYMLGPQGFKRAMAKLGELTQGRTIPVLVLVSSASSDQIKLIKAVCKMRGFHLAFLKPYVDALVERLGIEDSPEARQKALILSKTDPHPNPLGHEAYKDAVVDQIVRLGFVTEGMAQPDPLVPDK
jgi:hypothetical protein